VAPPEKTTSAV